MSDSKELEHDRYRWSVLQVDIGESQETLNMLTTGMHEVYATHVVTRASGDPQLLIIARQRTALTASLEAERMARLAEGPKYQEMVIAPFTAKYTSKCGHMVEVLFAKGNPLRCSQCKTSGGWLMADIQEKPVQTRLRK